MAGTDWLKPTMTREWLTILPRICIIVVMAHERHGVLSHRQLECLFMSLFWPTKRKYQISESQKLCVRNPTVTSGFSPKLQWCLTHLLMNKMAGILADGIFKCIFLNENDWIPIQISLKFVPRNPIDNKAALVQVMAWRRTGDKPLPEPMMAHFTDAYMRH